jgi:hypothetical protein
MAIGKPELQQPAKTEGLLETLRFLKMLADSQHAIC